MMPSLYPIVLGCLLLALARPLVVQSEDIEVQEMFLTMGVVSEPFTLTTLEKKTLALPVFDTATTTSSNNQKVRCTMTADAGDPDLIVQERRVNGYFGNYLCYDSRAGPYAECPDMAIIPTNSNNNNPDFQVTDFLLTITAYGKIPATNTRVLCESYHTALSLGIESDPLPPSEDITWFLLDTTGTDDSGDIQCRVQGEIDTSELLVYSETQDDTQENLCQPRKPWSLPNTTAPQTTDCEFPVETSTTYWIGVASSNSFSVLCEPVSDSTAIILEEDDATTTSEPTDMETSVPTEITSEPVVVENAMDSLTNSNSNNNNNNNNINNNNNNTQIFALGAGESLTFVTQAGPGEAVFCWIGEIVDGRMTDTSRHNNSADVHRHSEVELILGVNEPPNPKNPNVRDHDCHSDNFFHDDDVCFVYGDDTEPSTVYATVQSTALAGTEAADISLTCDIVTVLSLGTESAAFGVGAQGFQPFLVQVPSTTDRVVCSTTAKDGDIDLYVKVGEEGLANWNFDCLSTSDVAVEECDLTLPVSTRASTPVFITVYAYRPTTGAVLTCSAVDSMSVVVNRENPDLT